MRRLRLEDVGRGVLVCCGWREGAGAGEDAVGGFEGVVMFAGAVGLSILASAASVRPETLVPLLRSEDMLRLLSAPVARLRFAGSSSGSSPRIRRSK